MGKDYKMEFVDKKDALKQAISLADNQNLFAIYLDDNGGVNDLEYQSISSIKEMIEDGKYIFLKRTCIL